MIDARRGRRYDLVASICQRPVIPGFMERRRRCQTAYWAAAGLMDRRVVIDGRRLLDCPALRTLGLAYGAVGSPVPADVHRSSPFPVIAAG